MPSARGLIISLPRDRKSNPLGQKFGLGASALYNHAKKHISPDYIRAIKVGPFESEEQLRKLCAEAGTSVVQISMPSTAAWRPAGWRISSPAPTTSSLS